MGVGSGFNYREASHDLVACSYVLSVRLGLPSRLVPGSLFHEILLPVCLKFGSLLQTSATLYKVLRSHY